MYEWKVRAVASVDLLETELNGLERDGFEIHDIHWGSAADKTGVHVVARRAVARRNTDIQDLLSEQTAEARSAYSGSDQSGDEGL